ncbi:MAG: 6-bladed beta-propeller [Elusimicrobia bacterium]|nr:6-bladed beta-propeller [Elusimicrobiota bacterium]
MKKFFLLGLIITSSVFLYAAGLRLGMTGAVKQKVKELDKKVREKKAATTTVDTSTVAVKMPIAEWRIDEPGTGAPWGIALDSVSNMYASEIFSNKIKKFSPTGTFITQWGSAGTGNSQFDRPKFIDVDGSNNVYVADNMNGRVQKFSSAGTYITQWGGYGNGNGQFNGPTGIAVDIAADVVYVVDSNNSRVQKFSSTGTYITQWGSLGTGNGQFQFVDFVNCQQGPEGDIAVDSTGAVYVVDNWNRRIQKFSSTGAYITQWGSNGSGNGQFLYPTGIAVDSTGAVYVIQGADIAKYAP